MNERDQERDDSSYLWDGTGPVDPEVARLERALGGLRHRAERTPVWPERKASLWAQGRRVRGWAAAAAAIIVIAGIWSVFGGSGSSWSVRTVAGIPAIGGRSVGGQGRIGRGEWLVTDGSSRARIAVGRIGTVEVEPNTRLQLVNSGGRDYRMALERGTIHARIWAPPRYFYVNTEAAVAVDLGCAYTLHVSDAREGVLRVSSGWVGFEREGRDTYVPEGAVCVTRADLGPGTPRYEDAPSGYGESLMLIDFGAADAPGRRAAIDLVLTRARRRDAMTLWHLLSRGSVEERSLVYDRLAQLVPPPDGVTRADVIGGNRGSLNRWWDALGVDNSTWWRLFKKKW